MGMFDEVVCCYPLPHHQDARFQTKDLSAIALGERWIGGTLDEYEITQDGRLRRHAHEREWVEDQSALLGTYLKSVRDWWEDVPDAHGDVWIYTTETVTRPQKGVVADEKDELTAGDGTPGERASREIEFRIRFTNGRVQQLEDLSEPPAADDRAGETPPLTTGRTEDGSDVAGRSLEEQLLANIRESHASLEALLNRANDHWGREDCVYRHYHHSFKVYSIQSLTLEILTALQQLMPERQLCLLFRSILDAGTGKTFSPDHNRHWAETTRPMLEAFFHAHYFLEMVVKYGGILESPPSLLPSGWAAVLTLYGLR